MTNLILRLLLADWLFFLFGVLYGLFAKWVFKKLKEWWK